jgi:hypothetical protein
MEPNVFDAADPVVPDGLLDIEWCKRRGCDAMQGAAGNDDGA